MKLLIIRHGDPNYEIDGLTEKGEREVALLTDRLCREERIDKVYCSTYGRAKLTIEPTLKALGMHPTRRPTASAAAPERSSHP